MTDGGGSEQTNPLQGGSQQDSHLWGGSQQDSWKALPTNTQRQGPFLIAQDSWSATFFFQT